MLPFPCSGLKVKVALSIAACWSIAARCGFSADEARVRLLHRVKTGIRNKHARMKMRGEANLTYDTAIEIATDAEIVAAQDKTIQNLFKSLDISNSGNNSTNDPSGMSDSGQSEVQKVTTSFRGRGCQQRAGRGGDYVQSRGRGNIRHSWYIYDQPLQPPGGRGVFQSFQTRRECYTCDSPQHIQRFCQ